LQQGRGFAGVHGRVIKIELSHQVISGLFIFITDFQSVFQSHEIFMAGDPPLAANAHILTYYLPANALITGDILRRERRINNNDGGEVRCVSSH
jgi:hypothetical protein